MKQSHYLTLAYEEQYKHIIISHLFLHIFIFLVPMDCKYDVVILTDKSGSIVGSPFFFQNWVYTRFFLIDLMERLASFPDTRLSFVTFATEQQVWFRLGDCQDSICIRRAVYSPSIPVSFRCLALFT